MNSNDLRKEMREKFKRRTALLCSNCVFCDTFGELKCIVKQRRIRYDDDCKKCTDFKKAESVDPEKHPCHCHICEERRMMQEDY